MVSPIRRRQAVEHIRREHPEVSTRRACELVGLSRNAVKAPTAKVEKDTRSAGAIAVELVEGVSIVLGYSWTRRGCES